MKQYVCAAMLLCLTVLSGCSKPPPPTVEEKVLMTVFSSLIVSGEYDRVCNGGKITQSKIDKDTNVYWYANMQTIVAMLAAPLRVRHPKDTVEEGVARLQSVQKKIETKARETLTEQGCDSEMASNMARSLDSFVKTPPWVLYSGLAAEIKKQGGTLTQLTEEQNKISPPQADKSPKESERPSASP